MQNRRCQLQSFPFANGRGLELQFPFANGEGLETFVLFDSTDRDDPVDTTLTFEKANDARLGLKDGNLTCECGIRVIVLNRYSCGYKIPPTVYYANMYKILLGLQYGYVASSISGY